MRQFLPRSHVPLGRGGEILVPALPLLYFYAVIVRSGNLIKIYTKGADSIIKARLSSDQKLNLDDELLRFSRIGLRTLLIGMRLISNDGTDAKV